MRKVKLFKQGNFKFNGIIFIVLAIFIFFILTDAALAQGVNLGVDYGENIGLSNRDPREIVVDIIQVALGFLAIIAVILILYAGYTWMVSGGDPAKVDKAKKILKNASIGLVIILASWGITAFIVGVLFNSMFGGPPGGGGGPGVGGGIPALGSGIIESHYPTRNQVNVARNTVIVVTFKESIDPTTICNDGGDGTCDPGDLIIPYNVRIYLERDGDSCVAGPPASCPTNVNNVEVISIDNKTFVFRPQTYLGNSSEKLWYYVALGTGILKGNGDRAFPGAMSGIGYSWKFEVGTFIDLIPPKITGIIPQPNANEPRNVVVQINFNEAINPLSGSGSYIPAQGLTFNNIEVQDPPGGSALDGNYYISNQYKTIEFITENACGTNSCGQTVYCLPGNATLRTLAKAATLITVGQPTAQFPYNGIVDMADNSLDGNSDGTAQGPQAQSGFPPYDENAPNPATQGDDYEWTFSTNNTINITPPIILAINPAINAVSVGLNTPVQATFDKLLMGKTLNTYNVYITPSNFNQWTSKTDDYNLNQTTVFINHDSFGSNVNYAPHFNQDIQDIYQNCYSPAGGLTCAGSPPVGSEYCCNGSWMTQAGFIVACP